MTLTIEQETVSLSAAVSAQRTPSPSSSPSNLLAKDKHRAYIHSSQQQQQQQQQQTRRNHAPMEQSKLVDDVGPRVNTLRELFA
jgi:ribosome-binding protein aMBF1 (putative translation factor)